MVRNDATHWGWPAKTLHWLGAILIVALLAHGWWMTHWAPRADRFAHYTWHASIGYDFLALLCCGCCGAGESGGRCEDCCWEGGGRMSRSMC
jgi:cytochrome b561